MFNIIPCIFMHSFHVYAQCIAKHKAISCLEILRFFMPILFSNCQITVFLYYTISPPPPLRHPLIRVAGAWILNWKTGNHFLMKKQKFQNIKFQEAGIRLIPHQKIRLLIEEILYRLIKISLHWYHKWDINMLLGSWIMRFIRKIILRKRFLFSFFSKHAENIIVGVFKGGDFKSDVRLSYYHSTFVLPTFAPRSK